MKLGTEEQLCFVFCYARLCFVSSFPILVWNRLHWICYCIFIEESEEERNFLIQIDLKGFFSFEAAVCVCTCFSACEEKTFLTELDIKVTVGHNFEFGECRHLQRSL